MLFLSSGYAQEYKTWNLPEEATMRIGKGGITALKFSPDGNELAVASQMGIWIYSADTGAELALLTGHTARIQKLAFLPNRKILASTSNDRTIRLWDTESGKQLAVLSVQQNFLPWALVFSPDSATIASGGRTGTIHMWNAATGVHLAALMGHTDSVEALAFSPDGRMLASASQDTSIRLWDSSSGEHLSTLTGHKQPVEVLVFSPDGKTLASAGMGGTVRLWNPDTGKMVRSLVQLGLADTNQELPTATRRTMWIDKLAFSPDGSTLASGDRHGIVQLWRVSNGSRISITTAHAHMRAIRALAFSMDKPIFMTADEKGTIHSWNAFTGAQITTLTLKGHGYGGRAFGFSADGATLMSVGWALQDETVRFWDINGNREFTPIVLPQSNVVNAYAFSPDGKILAGATDDMNIIELWNLQTSSQHATLAGHTWFVETLVFSSDSGLLASGDRTGAIFVWDVETGHRKKTLKGHQISVKALAFSPDSGTLASASHRSVCLWDISTSTLRTTLIEQEDSGQADMLALAFSPDGKTLASAGRGQVLLWDVDTHHLLSELARHGARVRVLAFSPDSTMLLIGCGDGAIEIWDTDTYTRRSTTKPHAGRIEALKFSPDGRTLASGSMDGTILLWHWASLAAK